MISIDNHKRYIGIVDEAGVGRAAILAAGIVHDLSPFLPEDILQNLLGVAGIHDYTDQYDWTHETVVASLAEKGIEVPRYKTRVADKTFADKSFMLLAVCNPVMLPLFIKRHPNIFVYFQKDPPENSRADIDEARDALTLLASFVSTSLLLRELSSERINRINDLYFFRRYRLSDEHTRHFLPVYSNPNEARALYKDDTWWMQEETPKFLY